MKALKEALQLAEIHWDEYNLDRFTAMLNGVNKGRKLTKAEEQDIYSYIRNNRK